MTHFPEAYFARLLPPRSPLLQELEAEAQQERIPIVGPVVAELIFILAKAMGAQIILELGPAIGYSTIYLAEAAAPQGRVIALEMDPEMARRARINLERAGLADLVEIKVGLAQDLLPTLTGPFDFIFMDIDKEGYRPALEHCWRLLRPGGLLVTDNTSFAGAGDFNQALAADRRWRSVNLFAFLPQHSPEHDGLALAIKV